jgi:hypothetical protein
MKTVELRLRPIPMRGVGFAIVFSLTMVAGWAAYVYHIPEWMILAVYSAGISIVALRGGVTRNLSPAVWCELGNSPSESGAYGLRLVEFSGDGMAPLDHIGDSRVRRTDNRLGHHYVYFAIDDSRTSEFRSRRVLLIVEYFDLNQHLIGPDEGKRGLAIHYDARGTGIEAEFKRASTILFQSTMQWRYAAVPIDDAFFEHRQQGVADIRFSSRTATPDRDYNIAIRRVAIVPF